MLTVIKKMAITDILTWWPIVTLLVGWLIYFYLSRNHNYWKKRGVPYVEPLLIFGNLKESILLKKFIGNVYDEFYWKFDGHKYAGIFELGKPVLLVRHPDIIKDVLVKEFSKFHDNEIFVDPDIDPLSGRNPFLLRGERWKVTRTRLMPAFTVVKLKPLYPLIQEVCEEMKKLISNDRTGIFEAKELCSRFTTDVVATCAYGVDGNAIQDPDSEFRRMGKAIINPGFFTNLKFMIGFLAPSITAIMKWRFIPYEVEEFFNRLVKEVMDYRSEKDISRNDYLQHLISLKNKSDNESSEKYPFDFTDVAAGAATFFFDGFETSAGTMTFVLYCLAVNPEVQEKLRQEIFTATKENGGVLDYDSLQKMQYLDMVFSESLRMFPVVSFMKRICTKKTTLETPSGGELVVEEGIPIVIPVYSLHRDPKYYPDPETFNPERFTEENKNKRHKYAYLPFGEGPRTCLGMRFANMQVKAGIVNILSAFEVKSTDRTPIPLVPDPSNFFFAAKGGIWLQFLPHHKS